MSQILADGSHPLVTAVDAMTPATPGLADVFNAMWQIMLNNDKVNASAIDALTTRLAAAEARISALEAGTSSGTGTSTSGGTGTTTPTASVITADFTATPATNGSGTVQFAATANSTGGSISTYTWDFGNGTTGSGSNTSRTYTTGGTYIVKLTVTDTTGASKQISQQVTVTVQTTSSGGGSGTTTTTTPPQVVASNFSVAAYKAATTSPDHYLIYGIPKGGSFSFDVSGTNWQGTSSQDIQFAQSLNTSGMQVSFAPSTATLTSAGAKTRVTITVVSYNENSVHSETGYGSAAVYANVDVPTSTGNNGIAFTICEQAYTPTNSNYTKVS